MVLTHSHSHIRAVLFDLDGVLIDSFDAWYHQFQDALRHFKFEPISEKVFRQHWGRSTADDVHTFMPGVRISEVRQYFQDHYEECMPFLKTAPHARDVLRELRTLGLRLGCVTNSHRVIVLSIMSHLELGEFFDAVVTADDVARPKPAPDMLLKICRRLDVMPREAVFVGDTETDLIAGEAAGCTVIGYRNDTAECVTDLRELSIWFVRKDSGV
jgi:HAD superfamily hydrolase (TIGR01509 family)